MGRLHFIAISLLLAACPSKPNKADEPSPKDPAAADAAPVATEVAIGSECTSKVMFGPGTCGEGRACMPAPGGYCSAPCSFEDCPSNSRCASGPRAGDLCMASCETDADCRAKMGYGCDPGWKVCTLPGLLGPIPPSCPDIAAPARASWSTPVQISTSKGPGKYNFEPAAALTNDGAIATLYITNGVRTTATKSPFPNVLAASVVAADGSVSSDLKFTSANENHFDPWVARDRTGLIHAVWLGFDGGMAPEKNMKIGYSTTMDGVTWSAARSAHWVEDCPEGVDGCMDKPMIAIGPRHDSRKKDAIYVAYYSNPGGGMMLTRSIDGGKSFEKSVRVADAAYGDMEVDSRGVIHIVYAHSSPKEFTSREGRIKYQTSKDGGKTFAAAVDVSAPDEGIPFYFSNPQIAPDPARKRISVVYPTGDETGKWHIMFATSRDSGKTWKRVKANDDAPCANHMTPTAVLDAKTGAVHAAWLENRGGAGRVVATVCDAKKTTCSANEQVSSTDFAAYSFARHSPKWIGEYFSLVPDAKRKKLHAVWTQPVDEDGRAVARVFWASRDL